MDPQNNPARIRAKSVLKHYLKKAYQAGGLRWDRNNDAEVESLVDDLVDATKAELDATGEAKRLYVLTDGKEVSEFKWMTPDELKQAQGVCERESAGNWRWNPAGPYKE
jgi:hypothetical protein